MNTTVSIDQDTSDGIRDLPRKMSASKLFRHSVKANTFDAKQWTEYKKTPECQECLEFLRPIRERFGCK